jgi:hypothetical protein
MSEEILGNEAPVAVEEAAPSTVMTESAEQDTSVEAGKDAAEVKDSGGDSKDADKKSEDGEADKGKDSGAPDKYEDFTLPDGMQMDAEVLEQFHGELKAAGLSQEQGQKFIDLQTNLMGKVQQAQQQAWVAQNETWVSEAKADKEYGGLKWDASLSAAKAALDKVGTPELSKALDETGMGNHPEFIRFFARVGKAISEDNLGKGSFHGSVTEKTLAQKLYPNHVEG